MSTPAASDQVIQTYIPLRQVITELYNPEDIVVDELMEGEQPGEEMTTDEQQVEEMQLNPPIDS